MSDTTNTTTRRIRPWQIRKLTYAVVAIIGVIAAYFGVVDEGQVDAITASPLLATLVGMLATAFTDRGSDSTATGDDVRAAQASAPDLNAIAEAVRERVGADLNQLLSSEGRHAAKPPTGATYPGGEE